MKRTRRGQVVGFIITPGEIANRIAALDNAIALLDGDVRASTAPRLNTAWRTEWDAFRRRWQVERDSYATWDSRLFATRVMPRVEDFENAYRRWAREYQDRAKVAPRVPGPAPVSDFGAVIPAELWWILAGAAALYILVNSKRGLG
jgi:hypothetical protein